MRASSASTFGSLVSTVTASAIGSACPASRAPSCKSFDSGAQHRLAPRRMEVEEVDASPSEDARGAAHRVGNVVELQVGEDPEPLVA